MLIVQELHKKSKVINKFATKSRIPKNMYEYNQGQSWRKGTKCDYKPFPVVTSIPTRENAIFI